MLTAASLRAALPSSAILDQRFDRMNFGFKIGNLLQDAFAREETDFSGFQQKEVPFGSQPFDERLQIRHAMRSVA